MSGLLERIARWRRASASSRLGPPPQNGVNGTEQYFRPAVADGVERNGRAPEPEPEPVRVAEEAEAVTDAEPEVTAEPEPEPEPEPELAAEPEPEPEPHPAPAPRAPPAPPPVDVGTLGRAQMRRRARYLRALREVQFRDIGGFMVELRRFGRERPNLVERKVEWAANTDRELRALEQALNGSTPLGEVRQPGIGGACAECGAVHGSTDRFCSTCGAPLSDGQDDDSDA